MPKEIDMIKASTVKKYLKEVKSFKISTTAVDELRIRFNTIIKDILGKAVDVTKEDKRKTIMPRDIKPC